MNKQKLDFLQFQYSKSTKTLLFTILDQLMSVLKLKQAMDSQPCTEI